MKWCLAAAFWLGLVGWPLAVRGQDEGTEMLTAKGAFEVELTPQADADTPAGRMLIDKTYKGDMVGVGTGQMISKRTATGTAAYFAIEEFRGSVKGNSGGFTLLHKGYMNSESQSLEITILEGSGSGDLDGISGSMSIIQDESGHRYELKFEL